MVNLKENENAVFEKDLSFKGHTDSVSALVYDDSHGLFYTASLDKSIKVWNLKTGALVKEFRSNDEQGHKHGICALTFWRGSLYSGSFDATIIKWEHANFQSWKVYQGHSEAVYGVLGVDTFLISISRDGTVRVWDEETAQCIKVWQAHNSAILSVALVGRFLYTGSDDRLIRKWEWQIEKLVKELAGHEDSVTGLKAWTEDILVSSSYDCTVRFWDVSTGRCTRRCEAECGLRCVEVCEAWRLVLGGGNDASLYVWDLYSDASQARSVQGMGRSGLTCLDAAGPCLLVASNDHSSRSWLLKSHTSSRPSPSRRALGAAGRDPSRDGAGTVGAAGRYGKALAAARDHGGDGEDASVDEVGDGVKGKHDTEAEVIEAGVEVEGPLYALRLHDDKVHAVGMVARREGGGDGEERLLVTASSDHSLRLYPLASIFPRPSTSTPAHLHAPPARGEEWLRGHKDRVLCLAPAGEGVIYSGSADGIVLKWTLLNGVGGEGDKKPAPVVLQGHTDWVSALAVGSGSVYSGSWDTTIRQWDMASNRPLRTLRGHTDAVYALALLPGVLLSGSRDCTVRAWDVASGGCLRVYAGGHTSAISALVARDPHMYTASWDKSVRRWDLASGENKQLCPKFSRPVLALALTNAVLLVAVSDGSVHSLSLETCEVLHTYRGHKQGVNGVVLLGTHMFTCADDARVLCWPRSPDELGLEAEQRLEADAHALAEPLAARIQAHADPSPPLTKGKDNPMCSKVLTVRGVADGGRETHLAAAIESNNLTGRLVQSLDHVQLSMPPPLENILYKKGSVFGLWSARLYRLANGLLVYYALPPEGRKGPEGGFRLGLPLDHVLMSDLVQALPEDDGGRSGDKKLFKFRVVTLHRTYMLAASSDDTRSTWLSAFNEYVERNTLVHKMEVKRFSRKY